MPGTKPMFQNSQNFAEVYFQTAAGVELRNPLKIVRPVGESYQVSAPVIEGYLLISQPGPKTRIMGTSPAWLRLIYDRIGSLRIYQGLDDIIGEGIKLKNGAQPEQVAPVTLPAAPSKFYFQVDETGIGEQVKNLSAFVPQEPTKQTSLLCLSADDIHELKATDLDLANVFKLDGIEAASDKCAAATGQASDKERQDKTNALQNQSLCLLEHALIEVSKAIVCLSEDQDRNRELIDGLVMNERQMLEAIKTLIK
ncbi:hypothetical protein IWT25_01750 [Secundilactobacillus pentosiphilus]|uniref:MucBP domain-containing protein n=1 Tax=Secundilactobacillus pentosiphilus TaxID=1714682 RepID=A0A1Z5IXL9_9LACO|nr:MucBP domain-containing protein [Secundilactobacillus pentosiphilus]GAX06406.1 hypothetical protein IWT25_01750 [Secundilactobacillus pentosiphilus]